MSNYIDFIGGVLSSFFADNSSPFYILFGSFFVLGLFILVKNLIFGGR